MRLPTAPLLLSFALLLASPVLAAEQAGVSAAVRGQVALTRVQVAVGRQVVGGEPILLQDAIQSGRRSGMQILLLDQTVFTIGPESERGIDEFVYDPKTDAGKLSAEITKGVFRFVSGKIAHEKPEDMKLKLPSGTLGVRGTMVAGRVDPAQQSSRLVLLGEGPENDTGAPAGAFEACNAGQCVRVSRPGYGTSIDGPDAPPATPFLFSREELDELTRSVSDPEGWVETAKTGTSEPPAVAAGPPEEQAGTGSGDSRSATEVSGIDGGGSAKNSEETRVQLRTLEGLDQATTDVSQFSDQTVLVNGREVAVPENCSDLNGCLLNVSNPVPFGFGDITTLDQLLALGASGLQQASYQASGLGLIDTQGRPDGSYDFSLQVSLGSRSADLVFTNVNSSILGLDGTSFGQTTDFSSYPAGYDLPLGFAATANVLGGGVCGNGCPATGAAFLMNANGRLADAAQQTLVITAPDTGSGLITGTVSETPYLPIRRP